MKRTIDAVFDGEVLRPCEPLDLAANVTYRITVEDIEISETTSDPAAGVFDTLLDLIQPLDLPIDFASQLHHYVHGHPKQ